MDVIIPTFMEFANQIKLYHWKTKLYSRHKATDKFLQLFNTKFDQLVETMMGNKDKRVCDSFDLGLENQDDKTIIDYIKSFRRFLQTDFNTLVDKKDSELLNIRDEILADTNRMLYLFSFKY